MLCPQILLGLCIALLRGASHDVMVHRFGFFGKHPRGSLEAKKHLSTYMACDNESAEMVLSGMPVCIVPHNLYILWSTPRFVTLVHYVQGTGGQQFVPCRAAYGGG